jgi:hypothetical protein
MTNQAEHDGWLFDLSTQEDGIGTGSLSSLPELVASCAMIGGVRRWFGWCRRRAEPT